MTSTTGPLGKPTSYPERYDADLLYTVERAPQRETLGIGDSLPFRGDDRWTAWEVAWLSAAGQPQVAIARFSVPCTSPRLVESKSVKLWIASFYNERFDDAARLSATMTRDLSQATGASVDVELVLPEDWARLSRDEPSGVVIDDESSGSFADFPDRSSLRTKNETVEETLVSRTFRSVCPVTAQPDYATIAIRYAGPTIDRAGLAAYLTGFRKHPGFHEHCVEQIFVDLMRHVKPARLAVEARFTRRGGIDINPFRTSDASFVADDRPTLRQ
ncbi:MAG TPA: NADPH-dependent 7-cyano-7-deazaguanine reductase QueF [Casimicrobiaceae bacterium]|nr:NADPH-dependent 7-cyano-7-deazaguanine reductase QueF [Casimicrobiaceae bacterium]